MLRGPSIPEIEKSASSRRHITPDAFAALLAALGDAPSKGAHYENLRSKLIFFFSRRLLQFPEDLADEVLDRLAFRLSKGTEIASIEAFALGIARHVALEQNKRKDLHQGVDNAFFDNVPASSPTQSNEEEIVRMERCLKKLPSSESRLLRGYYLSSVNNHIQARRNLADEMGVSPLALRQKVFLARQKLRECIVKSSRKAAK